MQRINVWKAVTIIVMAVLLAVLLIRFLPALAAVPAGAPGVASLSSSPRASEPAISQPVTDTIPFTLNKSRPDTWDWRATSAQPSREGPPSSPHVEPLFPKSTDPPWGLLRQSQLDVSRQRFTHAGLTSESVGLQRAKTLDAAPEVTVGETYDVWGYSVASERPAKPPLQTQWTPSAEPTPRPQEPATSSLPPGEPGPGLSPQSWLAQTYNLNRGTIGMMPQQPSKPGEPVQVSATTGIQNLSGQGPILPTVWQARNAVAGGSGVFSDSGQSLGSSDSRGVALGDVDGDGDLDAFVANDGANKVWLNDGMGTFSDSGQSLGGSNSLGGVALGDVDGDGDLDAFVANRYVANKVWLNDGTGTFSDSGQSLGSLDSHGVALGDVDGDGDLDAFVANWNQANKVWLNDGTGSFSDSGQSLGSANSNGMALGDVDGDGDLDAFVANYSDQANKVWLNDGTGSFSDSGQSLGSANSNGIALGDVDGDGDLDAFVADGTPGGQANRVWLNDGAGSFSDSGQSLGSSHSADVALGDVDGDSDLDAFVANWNQANRVWLNDGTGSFSDSGQSLGSANSADVALGDVDSDGDLDAFVANWNQANKVWLNQTAASQPAITVCETYNYVWGYSASTNSTLFLTLKSGATVKGRGIARTDGVGYFSGEFFDQGQRVDIAPGDTVEVSNGTVTTVEVPTITGIVDPVTDIVSGTILGVSLPVSVTIDIYPAPTEVVQANAVKTVSTDASGNFSADFSAQVDTGADYVAKVTYTDANGNHAHSHLYVQAVNVYEQFDQVFGYATPGSSVSITVKDPGGGTKAATTTTANSDDGYYDVSFDVDIAPGDTVEVTMDGTTRSVVVADLTTTMDLAGDDVLGTAPPGSTVRMYVWHPTETQWEFYPKTVVADGTGDYIADYTGVLDIGRYDDVFVTSPDDDGDETILYYHPPLACVNVTYDNVWGIAQPGATVTATLKDSGGSIKDVQVVTANSWGYYEPGFSEDVVTGDTVEVSGGGISATIPVQNLTADVDLAADIISGVAPASRPMIVRGWRSYAPGFLRTLTSGAGGTYSLNLSGQIDLYNGYEGHVYYSQADDHKVFVHYHAPVAHVNQTHDGVWGYAPEPGALVSVTVTNGSGVKATTTVDARDTDGYFEAFYDGSVDIAPGDTVEVSTNPWNDVINIQDIQITADPDTGIISGTGPANETIITQAWGNGYGYMAVPSDGSGNYVADLSDQVELRSGDQVRVAYFTDDHNEVYAYYFIPYVRVNQSHDWVQGRVQPNVPVTATLLAPDSTVKGVGTTWSGGDGWFHTDFWDEWDDRADVQANDTVQVEAGDSFFDVFVIPMTGDVDPSADTVCGQMFDGVFPAPFFVDIWGTGGDTHREGTTDEFGSYCADYSGSLDIRDGHEAFVVYTNPDGNQVGIVRSYLRVGVGITGDWLDIATAPGAAITATLKDSVGSEKDVLYTTANDDGRDWPGFDDDIQPGDIVEVQADGRLVSLDVVNLSASGDPDTDTVSGTAPPDSYVEARVWGHGDDHRDDTTSDEFGDWSIYFGDEYDIQPGDEGRAWWNHDDGHWFQVDFTLPYIEVHFRNYDWVQGRVAPNAWVEITLWDALSEVKGGYSDWASGDGWFGGWCILDDDGHCVDIVPGDTVEVVYDGGDPILIPVILITGIVDSAANTISGQIIADDLPTDAWTDIWWTREGAGQSFTTDEFGNYLVDYSPYDVLPGHWVNIWYTNPDGHQLGAIFSELRLDVDVSDDDVSGITDPGRTVTITLRTPDSSVKEQATDIANYEGRFWAGFSEDIAPGDTVEAVANPSTSVYVEDVTIDVDVDADTVCGTAPPDAWLHVGIHGGPWWDLAADEFGDYCADFSDEHDIRPGDEGEVRYESPEGHRLYYSFFVPYEPYVRVNQSHEWVDGRTRWPDTDVWVAVRDSDGHAKGWVDTNSGGDAWFGAINVYDEHGNTVDIVPGDTVEVRMEGESPISVPVIAMSGGVDADTDTVSGNIPAVPINSTVRVEVWENDGPPDEESLTDEFGDYLVDFSPFDLQSGHTVGIWYVNPDGNQVGIVRHALRLRVHTARDEVEGETWANVPVTVTVNGGETATTTSDEEGYFWTEFTTDITGTDTVEAWAGTSTQYASLYVEPVSAYVDDAEDKVWGYGPPDARLEVEVEGDWQKTFTDGSGYYKVYYDWDIGPWNHVHVQYHYPDGHETYYDFGPSNVGVDKWVRPWNVVPGDEFSFFIRYWNSSDAPASDMVITDTLPYPVTYQWDSSGTTPTIDPETNTLVWHLGTLAAHRERTFELRVRMDEDAPLWTNFQNQVEISDPDDSDPEDNWDEEKVRTEEPAVDVGIDKWLDGGRAFAGAELTYVLEYENRGSRTAHDVIVTDTLPIHTSFVDTDFEVGVDGISEWVDEAAGLVVWDIGTLEPGESQDFQLTVRVLEGTPSGTLLINRGDISTSDDDTWVGNDWDTDTQVVEPYVPDLWVEKWVESDVSSLDDDVTYRIEYHNDGPADAHGVVLTDTLPLSMTHLSHSTWTTATVAGDQVIWELGTVAAGHGGHLYLTTHIKQPVAVGTVLTNTVDISTTDAETDYLNNHYLDVLGAPRVICVPWVGDEPHRVWSGLTTTLKGTAKGYGLTTYEWDPGDGSPVTSGTVGDPYVIEESYAYGAPVGTVYTATLTVWGAFGWSDTDTYTVRVFNPTHGVEVDVAIDEGLWYIHKEANRYSKWGLPFAEWQTSGYGVAETASAVQAFQVQGHRPGGDPWEDPYVEDVQRGWNALFTYSNLDAMTMQPAGDPDGDGDGVGIGIYDNYGSSIYESGLAMMALATTGSPGRVAHTGPPVYVRGQTYHSIAQDMADWFAWGQNDDWSGWARGGWRYRPNSGDSDNSNTQFPILGLAAAEHTWGITVPPWVKDELRDYWLAYTQDPASGGFGYTDPDGWLNVGKTGAGIMGLAWTGVPITDTRVIAASQFIETHWYDAPDGNWNGNVGEMYAMYAVKKGSQLAGIQWYGPHNWNYEYSSWLVGVQWPDGSFDDAGNMGGWQPMNTSWAVMILSPGLYRPLPVPLIAPIHYGGIGAEWSDGEVLFDASDSHHTDPDREIVLFEWDFGDGSPVETTPGPITTHTYLARGAYLATLTVWDDAGASATAATLVNITAPDYPPVADPDGPYVGPVGEPLTLDGSASYDPDEWMGDAVVLHEWDISGGSIHTTTEPTLVYTWTTTGTFPVTLRVRDRGADYGLDSPKWSTPVETTVTVREPIIIHVDYSNDTGWEDGTQEHPYDTINEGLDAAIDGDTILVAQGTYTENITIDREIAMEGGYASYTSPVSWTRDITLYETIIDGSANGTVYGDWDGNRIHTSAIISDGGVYKMWYVGQDLYMVRRIGYATSSDGVHWSKLVTNPVFTAGVPGQWDDEEIGQPHVIFDGGEYKMWYSGLGTRWQIGYATSPDGLTWTRVMTNPVLQLGDPGEWDEWEVSGPFVIKASGVYTMWYQGKGSSGWGIGLATSPDGINWTKYAGNPILTPGAPDEWDGWFVGDVNVVWDGTTYHLWYAGGRSSWDDLQIGYATSSDGIHWTKYAGNPALGPGPSGAWDEFRLVEPNVLLEGSTYKMWFSGDDGEREHKGYAWSSDGITWTKHADNPVLSPGTPGQWGQPVVRFDAGSDGSVLDGFTITGGDAQDAGGVHANEASITIRKCLIHDNFADGSPNSSAGAGVLGGPYGITLTIVDSRIVGNQVNQGAGGVRVYDGTLVMINTLIADNHGEDGLHLNGPATLMNVTVSDNDGGILFNPQFSATLRITNSIIYNNGRSLWNSSAGTVQIAYSDVEGGWPGTGNIDADPLFVGAGDYHLTSGSPCIDAGTADGAPDHDFEGDPRPWGFGVDMGADEYYSYATISEVRVTNVRDTSFTVSWITNDAGLTPTVPRSTAKTTHLPTTSTTTLLVATSADYWPMEYISGTEIVGHDIDLMNAIGAEIGVTIVYTNVAWGGIIDGLIAGEYDAIIATLTVTPEREEVIDFTLPYVTFEGDEDIAIAVQQGDETLRHQINEALRQLRTDGTLQTIITAIAADKPEWQPRLPDWPNVDADGEVHYGTNPANLGQTAYDDRGPGTSDDTHHVTLTGLTPETTYYFDVVSGSTTDDNGGAHYTVTTGPTLGLPGSDTIWGQVFKEDGTTLAEGTIVYITLQDTDGSGSPDEAATLSALVDDTGYWTTNLGNARLADLSAYFTYSASGDRVRLEAQGAADGAGCLLVDTADDSPAADLILNVSTCLVEAEIPLQVGWNHISLPVEPVTSYTAEGVCDEIISQGGDVTEIDRWYASGWDGHICGLPFNNFDIELGSDYFIKSSAVSTWTIEGYEVTTPVPLELQIGWNSIGIPHTDAYTAESLCVEINYQCGDGTALEVDRWYASGWDGHICGLPFNNFDIEIGTGYFVKAGGNCTLTPITVIGVSEVPLDGRWGMIRSRETNEGDLVADALLWQARQLAVGVGVPMPEVAFQNGGGIRNDSIIPPGPITEEHTVDMLPFPNSVTIVQDVTPEDFKALLENAVSRINEAGEAEGSGTGRFAQVAGFRFTYDSHLPVGDRVLEAILDDGTVMISDGAVADTARNVHAATIDFLAHGGDDYDIGFADHVFTLLDVTYQRALRNYIQDGLGIVISATKYPEGGLRRITNLAA